MTPTERTLRLACVSDSIEEALAFVVQSMDTEGIRNPQIMINPIWWCEEDGSSIMKFDCAVSGTPS